MESIQYADVVVAGGRDYTNFEFVCKKLDYVLKNIIKAGYKINIIWGGAAGADTLGQKYAALRGYKDTLFKADWNAHGKKAGYIRNEQMAIACTHVVCFWDGQSKGTKHMIELAKKHNKHLVVSRYMRFRTISMSQAKAAVKQGLMKPEDLFDITVKSAKNPAFTPTWNMVNGVKADSKCGFSITIQEYTDEYRTMMLLSYKNYRADWDRLISMVNPVLACFCGSDDFCHRFLLADMLVKLGCIYDGELTKEKIGVVDSIRSLTADLKSGAIYPEDLGENFNRLKMMLEPKAILDMTLDEAKARLEQIYGVIEEGGNDGGDIADFTPEIEDLQKYIAFVESDGLIEAPVIETKGFIEGL